MRYQNLSDILLGLRLLGHGIKDETQRTVAQDIHDSLGALLGVWDDNGLIMQSKTSEKSFEEVRKELGL